VTFAPAPSAMNQTDRQFIRHPSEIPLEYCITEQPTKCNMDFITNISRGGVSFHSHEYIAPEKWLHLYIPVDENYFEADAQVRWCKKLCNHTSSNDDYDVGVSFSNMNEAFSARMIEQVCYIEEYKKRMSEKEGRKISSDQAAAEWIEKYADTFPPIIN
jgi:hypothetical protein